MDLFRVMQVMADLTEAGDPACKGIGFLVRIIKNGVFPILQIGIPIVLIVFGTIDLGKAVISSDDKQVKEAQSKLIKRCIYAVLVFFIVTIVSVITSMVAGVVEADTGITSWLNCWRSV